MDLFSPLSTGSTSVYGCPLAPERFRNEWDIDVPPGADGHA
jgi:hypothetical protein